MTKKKLRILISRLCEFRTITIIGHQRVARRSIVVKTLFISIASFDCFSLLIVRGGRWPPAHSCCHLCWQAAHLFTESLNQILVLRMQKAPERWKGGKLPSFSFYEPNASGCCSGYFSAFINSTSAPFQGSSVYSVSLYFREMH